MNAPNRPHYPDITVQLTGGDGNAMVIVTTIARALRHHGHPTEASQFVEEAMSGNYNNVLTTAMKWVNVE